MKDHKKILFGVILLLAGVLILLNAFGITDINVWFPGWWTLFIIIPCAVGLFTDRDKVGNIIGLLFGVGLLLWQLDIIDISLVWKLLVPAIIIVVALKLIVSGFTHKDCRVWPSISAEGLSVGTAIFGGKEMSFAGRSFDGCELTAIFGGVDCDLRGAVIEKDCVIRATAIFGGIDIIMPKGVNVKINSTNVFGGTDDECEKDPDATVTLYVETVSIFGGVDLK